MNEVPTLELLRVVGTCRSLRELVASTSIQACGALRFDYQVGVMGLFEASQLTWTISAKYSSLAILRQGYCRPQANSLKC